ncbi:MAG: iron-containing alcohol dehydrogenase [Fimbriimonadaceae bacterium]|nr:iron-containing alcohol dehydrogenase [Fimbriimonadaceae bacterium]
MTSMHAFTLYTPTRIFFGSDFLADFAASVAQLGQRALIVTGGGTVARLGYLDEVRDALSAAGIETFEFSGIEPNPEKETVNRATAYLREVGAQLVVALGGGSVMDAAKAIAMLATTDDTDIWPYVLGESKAGTLVTALPVVAIPTTAATASEVTPYAVISSRADSGKSVLAHESIKPKVSWLNPAYTTGLSVTVTEDGAADILSHVLENYLLGDDAAPLADRYTEGVITTVLETLPELRQNPTDLAGRGRLLWASTMALNGYQMAGRQGSEFVLHSMEHALSAFRPELAHGRGLATLYPAYFRWLHASGRAVDRLASLGRRLFGMTGDDATCSFAFQEAFETWLEENGLRQSLGDLGFSEDEYPKIAEYAVRVYGTDGQLNARGPLPVETIVEIFRDTARQSRA